MTEKMLEDEYEKSMSHLLELSKSESWKAYVWQRVQEIDRMHGFAGFQADFLERVSAK